MSVPRKIRLLLLSLPVFLLLPSPLRADIWGSATPKVIRIRPCFRTTETATAPTCVSRDEYLRITNYSYAREAKFDYCDAGADASGNLLYKNCVDLKDEAIAWIRANLPTRCREASKSPDPACALPPRDGAVDLFVAFAPLFDQMEARSTWEHKVIPAALVVGSVALAFTGFGLAFSATQAFLIAQTGALAFQTAALSFQIATSAAAFGVGMAAIELPPLLAGRVYDEIKAYKIDQKVARAGGNVTLVIPPREGMSWNDKRLELFKPLILAGGTDADLLEEAMEMPLEEVNEMIFEEIRDGLWHSLEINRVSKTDVPVGSISIIGGLSPAPTAFMGLDDPVADLIEVMPKGFPLTIEAQYPDSKERARPRQLSPSKDILEGYSKARSDFAF